MSRDYFQSSAYFLWWYTTYSSEFFCHKALLCVDKKSGKLDIQKIGLVKIKFDIFCNSSSRRVLEPFVSSCLQRICLQSKVLTNNHKMRQLNPFFSGGHNTDHEDPGGACYLALPGKALLPGYAVEYLSSPLVTRSPPGRDSSAGDSPFPRTLPW